MTFPTGFTRLLDALLDDADPAPRRPQVPFGLFTDDRASVPSASPTPPGFAAAAYAGHAAESTAPPARTRAASHQFDKPLPSLDPADIAAELRLPCTESGALTQARREFARRNHPDRVPPHLRERASQRMQIANALIDEALRKTAPQGR